MSLTVLFITIAAAQNAQLEGWKWSDDEATLAYSISQVRKPYIVSSKPGDGHYQTIEISNGSKPNVSFPGHGYTTFVIRNDKLYVTEYMWMASGCEVEGYDLKTGKSLWKTRLKGLGPVAHSRYSNRVKIGFEGDTLTIYGKEGAGKYRERVDAKSGKILENKVFEKYTRNGWG